MSTTSAIHPIKTCSTAECAELLGVSPDLVRGLILRGELKAHYVGRRVVIRHSDIDAYLERHQYLTDTPKSR